MAWEFLLANLTAMLVLHIIINSLLDCLLVVVFLD